jgi:hypothetical protein
LNRPSPAQLATATRLLALEREAASSGEPETTAAGRVYDKLHAHLAPLVGVAGVRLLFVRSAKLTRGEYARLVEITAEGPTKLRECLHAQDSVVATEAADLFATFLALLATFIGERLTTQVLRRAWPTIEQMAPTETET